MIFPSWGKTWSPLPQNRYMNIKKGVDEKKERERAPAFAVTGMADKNL